MRNESEMMNDESIGLCIFDWFTPLQLLNSFALFASLAIQYVIASFYSFLQVDSQALL